MKFTQANLVTCDSPVKIVNTAQYVPKTWFSFTSKAYPRGNFHKDFKQIWPLDCCYIRILSSLWLCTLNKSIQTHLLHFYVLLSTANQQFYTYSNPMSNYESYLLTAWTARTAWTASPEEKHPLNTTSVQLHHKASSLYELTVHKYSMM